MYCRVKQQRLTAYIIVGLFILLKLCVFFIQHFYMMHILKRPHNKLSKLS